MVNQSETNDLESSLDEQLDALEKKQKRKNQFYKKLQMKRGMIVIAIFLLMAAAAIMSLVSGINNAVSKNQAIIDEAKQEASKKGRISKPSSTSLVRALPATKLEDLDRKSLIKKREDSNEKQRVSDAKASNRSVIAKLDELKNNLVTKSQPTKRFSQLKTSHKKADLKVKLQRLFSTNAASSTGLTSSDLSNFDWLVAANTGGQNASKLKASIEYHQNNLEKLLKEDQKEKTAQTQLKQPSDDKPKKKYGIKRLVTQEESAMLLMKIDSSKDSPITAQIMDARSDLNGAKLACEFSLTQDQEAVQIKCNRLVIFDQSYSVNIIMLDPATRNANIVDEVDRHWWKWLAFSAATFAEGYLNVATNQTTVINTDGSQTTQSDALETAAERNRAALAHIGKTAIASGGNILGIPNQVFVDEYRPVILLYLDDLSI